jgi:hypothetical protein
MVASRISSSGRVLEMGEGKQFYLDATQGQKGTKSNEKTSQQSQLNSHLQPMVSNEKVPDYSDMWFHNAAIQWLVNTNQPIAALEHPSYQHIINVAVRTTNGVKILSQKTTREAIINSFEEQMVKLREWLLVDMMFCHSCMTSRLRKAF